MELIEQLKSDITLPFLILAGTASLFWLIQILYYFIIYKKPYAYEHKREKIHALEVEQPSVSVVIASKNEAESIARNLPVILEQNYPNFEVIVVNMGSTDETDTQLKLLSRKYPNLYHTYVPEEAESYNEKKLALTIGIKAAKNDILLFTEAYCKPVSDLWIQEFANEFKKGKEIVLGYCRLYIPKNVAMRKFISYDNLIHNLKFLSLALYHKPFMGISRNLAYKRELFFDQKGFSSVLFIENGEDDLFINRISKKRTTGVVVSSESMTATHVVNRLNVWKNLKSKYLYTKKYYSGPSSLIFGFETFSKYLFYLSIAVGTTYGIVFKNMTMLLLGLFLFLTRYLIQLFVLNRYNKSFDSGKYYLTLPVFDIFQPISNLRLRKREKRKRSRK